MDFGLTDEQEMLRETARVFVAKDVRPGRPSEWDESRDMPDGAFRGDGRHGLVRAAISRGGGRERRRRPMELD